jgi:hypothetical protein
MQKNHINSNKNGAGEFVPSISPLGFFRVIIVLFVSFVYCLLLGD